MPRPYRPYADPPKLGTLATAVRGVVQVAAQAIPYRRASWEDFADLIVRAIEDVELKPFDHLQAMRALRYVSGRSMVAASQDLSIEGQLGVRQEVSNEAPQAPHTEGIQNAAAKEGE